MKKDLSVLKPKSHSYIFHYCISELSMIQIWRLLVGQTLNITILSLSLRCCCTVFSAFCCVCLYVSRVVNGIVNLIMKRNYSQEKNEKQRERLESKLMFFSWARRQCELSEAWKYWNRASSPFRWHTTMTSLISPLPLSPMPVVFSFPWIINCVSTVPNSFTLLHIERPLVMREGKERTEIKSKN